MFKNYLKIAWRNLLRNKVYAVINIVGLALGISACLVIYLSVHFELSYDNFHPGKENIYRIVSEIGFPQEGFHKLSSVPDPVRGLKRKTDAQQNADRRLFGIPGRGRGP